MKKANKRPLWGVAAAGILLLVAAAYAGYRIDLATMTVVIWGEFRVPKTELTLARVDVTNGTTSHAYEIRNPQLVLQIARDVSRMRRLKQITPLKFPPVAARNYRPVTELTIITKKYGACGGSFWSVNSHGRGAIVWENAGGYYWAVPRA